MLELFIALFLAFSCPAHHGQHNHNGNGTVQTLGEDGGGGDDTGGDKGHTPPPPPPPPPAGGND